MPPPKRASPVGIARPRSQTRHSAAIAAVWNSLQRLSAVLQRCFTGRTRAVNAAIDLSVGFHAMPDDPAVAVWADRRQRVDRTFEAIECVMLSGYDHFKRLVIFIFANFACSHTQLFRASAGLRRCSSWFSIE